MDSKVTKEWILFLFLLVIGTVLVLIAANKCHVLVDPRDCHFSAFAVASFLFPLFTTVVSRENIAPRLLRAFISAVYLVIAYNIFVGYQDHPWFAQAPPGGCDGPCFGWYTFEFTPPYTILFVLAGKAILIGSIIYALLKGVSWFWRVIKARWIS